MTEDPSGGAESARTVDQADAAARSGGSSSATVAPRWAASVARGRKHRGPDAGEAERNDAVVTSLLLLLANH